MIKLFQNVYEVSIRTDKKGTNKNEWLFGSSQDELGVKMTPRNLYAIVGIKNIKRIKRNGFQLDPGIKRLDTKIVFT